MLFKKKQTMPFKKKLDMMTDMENNEDDSVVQIRVQKVRGLGLDFGVWCSFLALFYKFQIRRERCHKARLLADLMGLKRFWKRYLMLDSRYENPE